MRPSANMTESLKNLGSLLQLKKPARLLWTDQSVERLYEYREYPDGAAHVHVCFSTVSEDAETRNPPTHSRLYPCPQRAIASYLDLCLIPGKCICQLML